MSHLRYAFEILGSAWSQPWAPEAIAVYAEQLADVEPAVLLDAVRSLTRTSEWRPSIATIRRHVADRMIGFPSPEEASAQAELLDEWEMRRSVPWGAQQELPSRPEVHPSVLMAWESVGPFPIAAVFARAWRESRERMLVEAVDATLAVAALEAPDGS